MNASPPHALALRPMLGIGLKVVSVTVFVGMQTTLNGADVEVMGFGDELTVNGANVICGGVQTANATVYLIDSVLMPPSMG